MAAKPPVELTVDQRAIVAVRKAMAAEEDGKALRRDLLRDIRAAVAPAAPELQAAVRQIPSNDPPASPDLRDAVARQIKVGASLGGRNPGATIKVGTKQDPRGFRFAGRRLNNPKGWRHPVFGREDAAWVQQYGRRGVRWFEPTILKNRNEYRDGVRKAVDAMAERIAARVRRGQK
jgi:hypothetical protein